MDLAQQPGVRSVRCEASEINSADRSPTVVSYRKLSVYGASRGLAVIVENPGAEGVSEHPEELVRIFKDVGSENSGALPALR